MNDNMYSEQEYLRMEISYMVVSVILNCEYMKVEERIKWFLKSASYAQDHEVVLVTHEYIKNHLHEMIEKLGDRFYDDYQMRRLTVEEIEKLNVCYIPDEIFEKVYMECGSQTRTLLRLKNERIPDIEDYITQHINNSLKASSCDKVALIENCLPYTFASIRAVARYYNCPLVPYVFSAIRKVHGYTQTLYWANFIDKDYTGTDTAKRLYEQYDPKKTPFPILNKHEIIALLGKKRNLPLIPLMDIEGKYELGIIFESFSITPQTFEDDLITDDDLKYEASRWYSDNEMQVRVHPIKLDRLGVSRKHWKNDPVTFLLSCKRLAAVHSQMITKILLWNRVACVPGNVLPFSFLCSKDFKSNTTISESDLNFLLFCYFVPDACMYDNEYWMWRMTYPTPEEIMHRHILSILSELGYETNLLCNSENRLSRILSARGCTMSEIQLIEQSVDSQSITWECLSSRIDVIEANGTVTDIYCRNVRVDSNLIHSHFEIPIKSIRIQLRLLDDVDGFITIHSLTLDGSLVTVSVVDQYVKKNGIVITIDSENCNYVDIIWNTKDYESHIDDMS